ncbi:MAG: cyclase family protein [Chloroflexota bacterium]
MKQTGIPGETKENAIEIIDLTKVIDKNLPIYIDGSYSDPPVQIESWCTVSEQGFNVSKLSLGTQTGTHIDAPAHFIENGATLEALPVQATIGPYLWIDLDKALETKIDAIEANYKDQPILFLATSASETVELSQAMFDRLLTLPCLVWVIVQGIQVSGQAPLYFHQALAEAGKYLIEEVDEAMAQQVKAGGELIALPLRLTNVSGSPCRVVVRQAFIT